MQDADPPPRLDGPEDLVHRLHHLAMQAMMQAPDGASPDPTEAQQEELQRRECGLLQPCLLLVLAVGRLHWGQEW